MHCDCCDRLLSNRDATSKFADGRFVSMCQRCIKEAGFDPSVKILIRWDIKDEEIGDDYFDFESAEQEVDDGYES